MRNTLGIVALGTVLNLQMKRIPKVKSHIIEFLNWPFFIRLPLRVPVFFSPFLLFSSSLGNQLDTVQSMHNKYYSRIVRVRRTGDLRYFDPSGIL